MKGLVLGAMALGWLGALAALGLGIVVGACVLWWDEQLDDGTTEDE